MSIVRVNQLPVGAPRARGKLGCFGVIALLMVVIGSPVAIIVPINWPQPTCDALAPILGCKGGKTPRCTTEKGKFGKGVKRTSTYSIDVECPEGGGSSAPIWALSVSFILFWVAVLVVSAIRGRRTA